MTWMNPNEGAMGMHKEQSGKNGDRIIFILKDLGLSAYWLRESGQRDIWMRKVTEILDEFI